MLMKHTQVSREGVVTDPVSECAPHYHTVSLTHHPPSQPLAQLTYGALLSGRIAMVADSSNTAKKVGAHPFSRHYRQLTEHVSCRPSPLPCVTALFVDNSAVGRISLKRSFLTILFINAVFL